MLILFKYKSKKNERNQHILIQNKRNSIPFRMHALRADKNANNKRQLHIQLIFTTQMVLVSVKDLLDSTAGN